MSKFSQAREASRNAGASNKSLNETRKAYSDKLNAMYNPIAGTTNESNARDNYQTYPYDYFCGTQSKVFFGDIWVDDIVTIQYNVKQDKEPIYGYASQNFDAVARGVILVQGSFTIAFKEMGYLNVIQGLLETQRNRAKSSLAFAGTSSKAAGAGTSMARIDPTLFNTVGDQSTKVTYAPNGSPQIIRQQETIESILKHKKGNLISSGLALSRYGMNDGDKDFEDFAELLEDTIWGDSNGKPYNPNKVKFRRADEFDYTWAGSEDLGGVIVGKDDNYADTLNIMISFGDLNDLRAEHTMTVLNDVHIVNTAMVVAPTGEPIGETYYFFARDINKSLSKETLNTLDPIKYNIGSDEFTSKDANIQAMEEFLNKTTSIMNIDIASIAHYNDDFGQWEADTKITYEAGDASSYAITFKSWESKVDQVIQYVERILNSTDATPRGYDQAEFTKHSQWVLDVALIDSNAETVNQFKMVIEQQIPNTLTYKVISPTRNNYGTNASFTREDMWTPQPAKSTGEETPPISTNGPPKDASDQLPPTQQQGQEFSSEDIDIINAAYKDRYSAEDISKMTPKEQENSWNSIYEEYRKGTSNTNEERTKGYDTGGQLQSDANGYDLTTPEGRAAYTIANAAKETNKYAQLAQNDTASAKSDALTITEQAMLYQDITNAAAPVQPDSLIDEASGNRYTIRADGSKQWLSSTGKKLIGPENYPMSWQLARGPGLAQGQVEIIRDNTGHANPKNADLTPRPMETATVNTRMDYRANQGDTVKLVQGGIYTGTKDSWKSSAKFENGDKTAATYGHIVPSTDLVPGKYYPAGTPIGTVGYEPANSEGPHLHYETFVPGPLTSEQRADYVTAQFESTYSTKQQQTQVASNSTNPVSFYQALTQ